MRLRGTDMAHHCLCLVIDVDKDEGVGVGVREGRGERMEKGTLLSSLPSLCHSLLVLVLSLLFSCCCPVVFISLQLLSSWLH